MITPLPLDEAVRIARKAIDSGAEALIGRHVIAALVAGIDGNEAALLEAERLRALAEMGADLR